MARKLTSDKWLFLATLLLVCASVVMVYSASAPKGLEHDRAVYFVTKQPMWAALGVAAMALAMRFDYRHYKQMPLVYAVLAVTIVALVAVLFSTPVKGARRWFGLGSFGVQPSELAKLVLVIFTAATLERRMPRANEVGYLLAPIALVVAVMVALIVVEPDAGGAVTLTLIAAAMVFAAGVPWRYLVGAGLTLAPLAGLMLMVAPYRRVRILSFLDPSRDPLGSGYHAMQSLIAVGTGGIAGKGLGAGIQKLYYLPEPHTDFIYAVIGEELGLIGTTLILICFCVIVWRGLRLALRAPDTFGAFLALGITTMIVLEAFMNISVVLSMMPTKGIALPFVSAGGSSLLINLVAMGILLNISQHVSAET
jgi:cell division protein FtsW